MQVNAMYDIEFSTPNLLAEGRNCFSESLKRAIC